MSGSPSFENTLEMCFSVLRKAMPSRSAIAGFDSPSPTQLEHLALALGEGLERTAVVLRQQPCHDLGVERRAAGGDPAERVHELVRIGHAVLEQVAEPLRVLGEHARGDPGLEVLREDHDRRAGAPRADLVRRAQPFVGVRRRHADVDDRDLRIVRVDLAQQLLRGARPARLTSIPDSSSSAAIPLRTSRLSSAITTRTAAPP